MVEEGHDGPAMSDAWTGVEGLEDWLHHGPCLEDPKEYTRAARIRLRLEAADPGARPIGTDADERLRRARAHA